MSKNILITGGAGFIGSHLVNLLSEKYDNYKLYVIDSLTYASDLSNLNCMSKINRTSLIENVKFYKLDIVKNTKEINDLFKNEKITDVIHLAAESHVDNSILDPMTFINTNIIGTVNLLNIAKDNWGEGSDNRFYHISTDEVYGDLELNDEPFKENTPYTPSSPYSASKAASDHFVRAYGRTYNMDYVISNCSNNFGPHQHDEKLIPTVIRNLVMGEEIPVYGKGNNIRDWLWVGDHTKAIDVILHKGKKGETYNIGGDNELTNINLIEKIYHIYKNFYDVGRKYIGKPLPIKYITDRKGHDFRYSVNSEYLKNNLKWEPNKDMDKLLFETIGYYYKKYKKT